MPNAKKPAPVCDECHKEIDGQDWCRFTLHKNREAEKRFIWHLVECAFKGLTKTQ